MSHITLSTECGSSDFKILKGQITSYDEDFDGSAIIGIKHRDANLVTFKPLVPFNQGTPYTLFCDGQFLHFEIEKATSYETIEVLDIYPSSSEVPNNILKWYVHFSRPVNPVKIYDHIHFLDQDGQEIDRSILDLRAPLLSQDGTLLTIWVEPGRQKQLLGPNHHLGSVFQADHLYTLRIDGALKDVEGVAMGSDITHTFRTTVADRVKPSIEDWKIADLKAHTIEPLEIALSEQLDYGSLTDAISISFKGSRVVGTLQYDSVDKMISFIPEENWEVGSYTIYLAPLLEDLAGNNLLRLFDQPIGEPVETDHTKQFTLVVSSH